MVACNCCKDNDAQVSVLHFRSQIGLLTRKRAPRVSHGPAFSFKLAPVSGPLRAAQLKPWAGGTSCAAHVELQPGSHSRPPKKAGSSWNRNNKTHEAATRKSSSNRRRAKVPVEERHRKKGYTYVCLRVFKPERKVGDKLTPPARTRTLP